MLPIPNIWSYWLHVHVLNILWYEVFVTTLILLSINFIFINKFLLSLMKFLKQILTSCVVSFMFNTDEHLQYNRYCYLFHALFVSWRFFPFCRFLIVSSWWFCIFNNYKQYLYSLFRLLCQEELFPRAFCWWR